MQTERMDEFLTGKFGNGQKVASLGDALVEMGRVLGGAVGGVPFGVQEPDRS